VPDTSADITATAAQTRAAGSRILGFIRGAGDVIVDKLFDVANFLTKNAAGVFATDGNLLIGHAGAADIYNIGFFSRAPMAGTIDWDVKTNDASYGPKTPAIVHGSGAVTVKEGFRVGHATQPESYNIGIFAVSPEGGVIDWEFRTNDASYGAKTPVKVKSTGIVVLSAAISNFADDAAAAAGGVPLYGLYRTGSAIKMRVA
jgi:hypothetical protein